MKNNYLEYIIIDNVIYSILQYNNFHVVQTAVSWLHCTVFKPKRYLDKASKADSNGGICVLLRCLKPELCVEKSLLFKERNAS